MAARRVGQPDPPRRRRHVRFYSRFTFANGWGPPSAELNRLIAEDIADRRANTRAIVVVYKGKLVAEGYGDRLNRFNKFIGWSMTKSVNAALVGILTGQGRLDIHANAPVRVRPSDVSFSPFLLFCLISSRDFVHFNSLICDARSLSLPPQEWASVSDERHNITVHNMLQMASGIAWLEGLNIPIGLYMADGDCAGYYGGQKLRDPIGSTFEYSTGCSTMLARIVHENRVQAGLTNFEWAREVLFRKVRSIRCLGSPPSGVPLSFCLICS